MGQFRSYGGFDDSISSDGDVGFVGMNLRLLPNQLQPGEVRLSRNGRMDGYWQGRKGIALRSGALSEGANPLTLPFWLVDTVGGDAISAASLTDDVVSLTVTGHGLPFADSAASVMIDPDGADNIVTFTAVTAGSSGNSISIEYGDPNRVADGGSIVTVTGTDILVNPEKQYMVVTGTTTIPTGFGEAGNFNKKYFTVDGIIYRAEGAYFNLRFSRITVAGTPNKYRWELRAVATPYWISAEIDSTLPEALYTPDDPVWEPWTPVAPATEDLTIGYELHNALNVASAINADVSASSLVLAAVVGVGTGSVIEHPKTFLAGGATAGPAYLTVQGLGFTTTDPNGVQLVTPTDANTLTFPLTGANETYTIGGGNDKVLALIDDDAVGAIYGSCHFSDPNSNLQESIILATTLEAKKVIIGDYTVTGLPYPSGFTLDEEVEMIQAFDKVYIFRNGKIALQWVPIGMLVSSASQSANTVTMNVKNHGLTDGDEITVSGLTGGTPANGTFIVNVTGQDTFEYTFATSQTQTFNIDDAVMKPSGFTYVPQGHYTQPQTFNITSSAVSVTNGLLTATVTGNDTISKSDFVTIYKTTIPELEAFVNRQFEVVSATATQIKFYVPSGNISAGGSLVFEFGGRFSVNGGFTHMPAPPWATYFQRRLWCPLWYDTEGTYGSYTITDRGVRDEICASDILDGNTYDRVYNQFRITGGTADYTVAMQPFYEDKLMVLNRNSLHLVSGTQGALSDTIVTELTREIGCLARKSVVQYSNAVFFLSDSGVYGVEFIDQYNLRGINEPLSKNIQPLIDRINRSLAGKAVGIYFNNRYWLALPLDSTVGANDAQGNNSVLIYNILNKGWESIDNYGNGSFNIINFHIAQDGARNSLFLVNEFGGLHEVDANDKPIDIYSINAIGKTTSSGVDYSLVSRGYSFNTSDRKKFSRIQVQLESGNESSDATFSFSSEDPDSDSYTVGTVNSAIGNDLQPNEAATIRLRLGNPRGIYGTLTISSNMAGSIPVGRPKVNNIVVDATPTNRQTLSQS